MANHRFWNGEHTAPPRVEAAEFRGLSLIIGVVIGILPWALFAYWLGMILFRLMGLPLYAFMLLGAVFGAALGLTAALYGLIDRWAGSTADTLGELLQQFPWHPGSKG